MGPETIAAPTPLVTAGASAPSRTIAVVGTSFRRVGFDRLGGCVLGPDEAEARRALRAALGADELVVLATCNRAEVYLAFAGEMSNEQLQAQLTSALAAFHTRRGAPCAPADLYVHVGARAAEHLFTTVASLDSLVIGESDITRQVKRAAERARDEALLGPALDRLFERASSCARRVRAETEIGATPVSVASLAVSKIRKHFGKAGPRVSLLLGAGDMTRKVARALAGSSGERLLVNRTVARAEAIAARYGGRAVSLDDLRRQPPAWLDLIFTATSAEEPLVTEALVAPALEARAAAGEARPLVICDLGVPRDVDPALADRPGVLLVALDQLEVLARQNHARLAIEIERARTVVGDEVGRFEREDRFRRIAAHSARAILESRLAHLEASDREAILRFTAGLAERFARQPLALPDVQA